MQQKAHGAGGNVGVTPSFESAVLWRGASCARASREIRADADALPAQGTIALVINWLAEKYPALDLSALANKFMLTVDGERMLKRILKRAKELNGNAPLSSA